MFNDFCFCTVMLNQVALADYTCILIRNAKLELNMWICLFLLLGGLECCPVCDECEWVDWGAWTKCDSCGSLNEYRNRSRCTVCNDGPSMYYCGCYEEQPCHPFCFNQGVFTDKCECKGRYNGKCCEHSKYKLCLITLII